MNFFEKKTYSIPKEDPTKHEAKPISIRHEKKLFEYEGKYDVEEQV